MYNPNDVCCVPCGVKHMTDNNIKFEGGAVTANEGVCCVCQKTTLVVPIRHYNYLLPKQVSYATAKDIRGNPNRY